MAKAILVVAACAGLGCASSLHYPTAPPAPGAMVQVEFASAQSGGAWDVLVDEAPVCTTPCRTLVEPGRGVLLHGREDSTVPEQDIWLGNLWPPAGGGPLYVTAHGTSGGEQAVGITFTTLGGMAAITGITFTAVGCAGDRAGMCQAGLITLGAGAVTTLGAIWLIVDSLPHADVAIGQAARVSVAPGVIAGRF